MYNIVHRIQFMLDFFLRNFVFSPPLSLSFRSSLGCWAENGAQDRQHCARNFASTSRRGAQFQLAIEKRGAVCQYKYHFILLKLRVGISALTFQRGESEEKNLKKL